MIDDLKKILQEVENYRKSMHIGTTSVLVDTWLELTRKLIIEITFLEDKNEN